MLRKFSIVIPFYNRFDSLCFAIDSVLTQNYSNYEIILVDDGSVISAYKYLENKYNSLLGAQIIYIRNPINRERSYSRNVGSLFVTGEFVIYLDSDDILLPNYLIGLNNNIKSLNSVYYTNCERVINDIQFCVITNFEYSITSIFDRPIPLNSFIFPFELLSKNGIEFNDRISIFEDFMFTYDLLCAEVKFEKINLCGSRYYLNGNNTRNQKKFLWNSIKSLKYILTNWNLKYEEKYFLKSKIYYLFISLLKIRRFHSSKLKKLFIRFFCVVI